jgi:hypothetical protein
MQDYHLTPFISPLPAWVCDEWDVPVFPGNQDCTTYDQLLSQICGVIILPNAATGPSDWTTEAGWEGVVDNADPAKGRYLVGIGSFLPVERVTVDLSGGRLVQVTERTYQLRLRVTHMDDGHMGFGRLLESGFRGFSAWLEPLSGGLVGGPTGMRPVFVDCDFPYEGAATSVRYIDITINFLLAQMPQTTDTAFSFNVDPTPPGGGEEGGEVWGDPDTDEIWGDPLEDEQWDAS